MPEQNREHISKENFVTAMRRAGSRTLTLDIAWVAKEMGDDGQC